jgi:APA family basic amino acid/polyamine antiporter
MTSDNGNAETAVGQSVDESDRLPRVLGLFDATMIVVGSIIGSGIFLKVSAVDSKLAQYGFAAIMGVWLFVGLITLCGALALAELGAMFPQAGGPYLYIRESFGRLPAFLWGWSEFWVVRTGSVGALACATVVYFNELVALSAASQTLLALAIVVGLSAANYRSTRIGAGIQSLATVSKVLFLAGLIVLPFLLGAVESDNLQPVLQLPEGGAAWTAFFRALGAAMVAVLWPYDGWINLGPVAEDIRDPMKNVPRAMAIGLGLVVLVYMGANLAYHCVLPMSHLSQSETVAADVFAVMFGPMGATIAAVGVMISTFGATNSNMITGPRIYLAIARDGLVPQWLQRIHPQYRTPANTIVLQAVWTIFLVVLFSIWDPNAPVAAVPSVEAVALEVAAAESGGEAGIVEAVVAESAVPHSKRIKAAFDVLTDSVICAGLIFYGLAVAAVYVLRRTRPDMHRPYLTWGYPVTPALLLTAYVGAFVSMLIESPGQTLMVLALIAAGAVWYYAAGGHRQAPGGR